MIPYWARLYGKKKKIHGVLHSCLSHVFVLIWLYLLRNNFIFIFILFLFYYCISDIVIYLIYTDLMRKHCQLINEDGVWLVQELAFLVAFRWAKGATNQLVAQAPQNSNWCPWLYFITCLSLLALGALRNGALFSIINHEVMMMLYHIGYDAVYTVLHSSSSQGCH